MYECSTYSTCSTYNVQNVEPCTNPNLNPNPNCYPKLYTAINQKPNDTLTLSLESYCRRSMCRITLVYKSLSHAKERQANITYMLCLFFKLLFSNNWSIIEGIIQVSVRKIYIYFFTFFSTKAMYDELVNQLFHKYPKLAHAQPNLPLGRMRVCLTPSVLWTKNTYVYQGKKYTFLRATFWAHQAISLKMFNTARFFFVLMRLSNNN